MVCIQTLVKRRTSRLSSVLKGLSISNMAHHLEVNLLYVPRPILSFEARARILGGDSAVVDERDLLAQLLGLLQVVRRQEDREPRVVQFPDVLPQRVPELYVHARRRLVEKQLLGIVHRGGGKHAPPLHTAGERVDPVLTFPHEAEPLQQFVGPLSGLPFLDAVVSGVIEEDLLDGQELVQVHLLRGDPDHAPRLPELLKGIPPEDLHAPRIRPRQTDDAVDERGLPRPVWPQKPEETPGLYLQRDPVERQKPVRVRLLELLDPEGRDLCAYQARTTSSAAFFPESIEPFIEESSVYSPASTSPGVSVRFFGNLLCMPGGWANCP